MNKAQAALGVDLAMESEPCTDMTCAWKLAPGLVLRAFTFDHGATASQFDVKWNRGDKATEASTRRAFVRACEIAVAAAEPSIPVSRVKKLVGSLLKRGQHDINPPDTEIVEDKTTLYGSRADPFRKESPEEALFMCGAVKSH